MIMHFPVTESRKPKLKGYCLVGYDPLSERPEYSLKIRKSDIRSLKDVVRFESDDPEGYDSYKLEYSAVLKLFDLLGRNSKPPETLEYFVEPLTAQERPHVTR